MPSATTTILNMPVAAGLGGNEWVPVVQGGVNVRTQTGAIAALGGGGGSSGTASFVTANAESGLTGSRQLEAQSGVLALTDTGAQGSLTVGVVVNGIGNTQIRQGVALSVIGNASSSTANVADIVAGAPNQFLQVNAAGTALVFAAINTASFSGIWAVPRGGTGTASFLANSVLLGSGTATLTAVAPGTSGFALISTGTTSAPTWQSIGGGSGGTVPTGGTGTSSFPANSLLLGEGSNTLSAVLPGAAGLPLISTGTTSSPSYSVGAVIGGMTGATSFTANGVLIGSGTAALTSSTTLPTTVQLNITQVGTIGTGTWHGSTVGVPFGGTGATTFAANALVYGAGTLTLQTATSVASTFLTFNASGTPTATSPSLANGLLASSRTITAIGTATILTSDCRVLFNRGSAGTSTVAFPTATQTGGPILIKDINGNVAATAPLIMSFVGGQLADGLSTVTITVPYGAYWFNPNVAGTVGSWYLTVA